MTLASESRFIGNRKRVACGCGCQRLIADRLL